MGNAIVSAMGGLVGIALAGHLGTQPIGHASKTPPVAFRSYGKAGGHGHPGVEGAGGAGRGAGMARALAIGLAMPQKTLLPGDARAYGWVLTRKCGAGPLAPCGMPSDRTAGGLHMYIVVEVTPPEQQLKHDVVCSRCWMRWPMMPPSPMGPDHQTRSQRLETVSGLCG